MTKQNSIGSAAEGIIITVLVLGLIGALGYIFWQNHTNNDIAKNNQPAQTTQEDKADDTATEQTASLRYVDYRKDKKDATGLVLASEQDISKLDGASQALKDFFVSDMKKSFPVYDMSTDTTKTVATKTYTIDRVYGDYAVGSYEDGSAYFAWGPKSGNGAITKVAGTQNEAFQCEDLLGAKVPVELVDSRCIGGDSKGVLGIQKYSL